MRRLATSLVVAALAGALVPLHAAAALGPRPAAGVAAGPAPAGDLDALEARARAEGTVPVIVELATPFTPEGDLGPVGRAVQRHVIDAGQEALADALAGRGGTTRREHVTVPLVALDATAETIEALRESPLVARVSEDGLVETALAQSGPTVEADLAWAAGYDGSGRAVAVLDTGVDATHPFLAGKIVDEACFALGQDGSGPVGDCPNGLATDTGSGSGSPCAANGCDHGTHVAGIAAGDGTGVAGAPPGGVARGASVLSVRVFSEFENEPLLNSYPCGFTGPSPCAKAYRDDVIAGLEHVYGRRGSFSIAAVNLSLGSGLHVAACDGSAYKPIIDNLRSVGIVTVVASGNDGSGFGVSEPACVSSAVPVGSTSASDSVSWFTNTAAFLVGRLLLAPGQDVTSSVPGGGYDASDGTSMAAPHVTGSLAVLRQRYAGAPVDELLTRLHATGLGVTDPINGATFSRVRVKAALDAAVPGPPTGVSASAGDGQATVSWTAPSSDGGTPITRYAVTASPGGNRVETGGGTTTAVVTGLANGTAYTFTVTAGNALGEGPASAPSSPVTPGVPAHDHDAAPDPHDVRGQVGISPGTQEAHLGYRIATADGRLYSYGLPRRREHHGDVAGPAGGRGGRDPLGWWRLAGGRRRRHLLLRRRHLLRLHRRHHPQPAHRRHGPHPHRQGLLAGGRRRRHLLLRRRHLLRLHRRHHPQPAHRRHGPHPHRQGLLARGRRRRHLLLRRRHLLRLHRRHHPQPAHRRHGPHPPPARATGWSPPTAASSPSATPASSAPPAPSPSTSPSSAWPRRARVRGYRFVAADGGVFCFGDATFLGSASGQSPVPVVALTR
ncbi:MAG: S8 family serine peptidase [Acidimicrobiia bacterium]|nr:S8 family serine peptidase [Acidimicrobiia bacterium]